MKIVLLWLLSLPLSLIAGWLLIDSFSFINWLDGLFAAGLLLLMAGGALAVASGGFFRAFAHNWQTFFSVLSKREAIVREAEGRTHRSAARFRHIPLPPGRLLQTGFAYCLLSLVLSLLITQ